MVDPHYQALIDCVDGDEDKASRILEAIYGAFEEAYPDLIEDDSAAEMYVNRIIVAMVLAEDWESANPVEIEALAIA